MDYKIKLKLAEYYILFRMYYGRGYGHFSFISDVFRNLFTGGVFLKVYGINIPLWTLIVISFMQYPIMFVIGLVDKKIGLWQFESNYSARKLSPWNDEVLERLKKIETKINEIS